MLGVVRRQARWLAVTGIVVALVALAGCSQGRYHYATNSKLGVYFKVPSSWKPYNPQTLFETFDINAKKGTPSVQGIQAVMSSEWQVAYDGAGDPQPGHLIPGSSVPVVRVKVESILPAVQQNFSINDLRAADLLDPTTLGQALSAENGTQVTSPTQLIQPTNLQTLQDQLLKKKGFFGVHYIANVRLQTGELETLDITGWADTGLTHEYFMIVSCTNTCYSEDAGTIHTITSSFTVRGN